MTVRSQGSLDALVLGAGIIGLACARELRRRGMRVAVVDARHPGAATGASAGMLAPVSEIERLGGPLAAACCASRRLWRSFAEAVSEESGLGLGYDSSPTIVPALGPGDHGYLDRLRAAALELGERCQDLDPLELRRRLPRARRDVDRALLLPDEHRVDPALAAAALVEGLRRSEVPVLDLRPAERIAPLAGAVQVSGPGWQMAAGRVVVAAGAWTSSIAGLQDLPVRPVRGQMLAFEGLDWSLPGTCRTHHWYALGRGNGRVIVGATVEEVGFDQTTTAAARATLGSAAAELFPDLLDRPPAKQWAGLRPACPDELPAIGAVDRDVFVATGHFRNGVLLAPWTAEVVARLVAGDGAAAPVELSPLRFLRSPSTPDATHVGQPAAARGAGGSRRRTGRLPL